MPLHVVLIGKSVTAVVCIVLALVVKDVVEVEVAVVVVVVAAAVAVAVAVSASEVV